MISEVANKKNPEITRVFCTFLVTYSFGNLKFMFCPRDRDLINDLTVSNKSNCKNYSTIQSMSRITYRWYYPP